jgi:hypothetical protein
VSSNKRLTEEKEKKMEEMTHRGYEISDELWNKTKKLPPDSDRTL